MSMCECVIMMCSLCRALVIFFWLAEVCRARDSIFRSVPTTVKTSENDTVLLPCYIDNVGVVTIKWWWEGQIVADSGDPDFESPPRIRLLPNNTLQVSALQPEDTGEYTCQVVRPSPWGPVEQVHAIEVLYPPSVIPVPEDGILEVQLGEEVIMGCVASGVPHPIVTWSNEGEEIQLLDNRPKLRFQASSRHLSGTYQCIAINGVGEPATASIHLKVLFPPEIRVERPWVHAAPNIRTELTCIVLADPEATVQWLKNDIPVSTNSRVVALSVNEKHSLLFRMVHMSDFGHYTCRATNQLGQNQHVLELSGVANPAVFKNESGSPSEFNYTLIWEVDSYSAIIEYNLLFRRYMPDRPDNGWMKLIIPADSSAPGPIHTKSYTLTGLSYATVYEAMILSRNRFGWSKPSQVLKFATEGADLLFNELTIPTESRPEENILHAELATVLRQSSLASTIHISFFTFIVIFVHSIPLLTV